MKKVIILFFIALFLGSCAGGAQPTTSGKGGIDTPSPQSGTETPSPAPDSSSPVIRMEKSGGIAGIHNTWTIYADGRAFSGSQALTSIPAGQVTSTLAEIQNLGFFEMQDDYLPGSTCADCFQYRITIHAGGVSKTVTALDGDAHTPAKLLQIIDDIDRLVGQ